MTVAPDVARWVADLEARHLRALTRTEAARALRALSSTYVERRGRLAGRGAFDSAGKRAAYALYYGPRRLLLLRAILSELAPASPIRTVYDLGCGTGAAGAAWATSGLPRASIKASDRHPWAVQETRSTLAALALHGEVRQADLDRQAHAPPRAGRTPAPVGLGEAIVLSYVVNELDDATRARVLPWLLAAAGRGARVLVVEPLARGTTPWWPAWTEAFVSRGGRADEWKRALALPPVTTALGRAAGLGVTISSARTLLV